NVLAPTVTIAFMMDCDTTGVEPDISLVKFKNLSGGGYFKIVNRTVPAALRRLGYAEDVIERIGKHIDETGTIEGSVDLNSEHLAIFDCAFRAQSGQRSIAPSGHIRMLGAVQPFLSGAVSKTVNVPEHTTVEEIMQTYIDAWKLGVKAVAIYRDNSKRIQPLETGERTGETVSVATPDPGPSLPSDAPVVIESAQSPPAYRRHRLPDERQAMTHKFTIGEHEGYMTIGEFDDGSPGEVFVHISKEGSAVSGLMDAVGTLTSVALQSGVPLSTLVKKFAHMRFEPSGWTRSKEIPHADSILDYVFRWMGARYLDTESSDSVAKQGQMAMSPEDVKLADEDVGPAPVTPATLPLIDDASTTGFQNQLDAPPCAECGSIMVRSGSCFRCMNCGATSGCS
ncbi:MAG: vitamin B12-dependent ribonucleotide reductase, partial [Chloroflexi bacterium]|nr:vitamin B12-dependent ribonucleotide reductase [Chloroflexota bacterium]